MSNLFKKLFLIEPIIYLKEKQNVVVLSKQSKNLVFTLKNFGLRTGNKMVNAKVPDWILENTEFAKAFVRGLIDTDGSVYPKTKKHRTPTIWLTTGTKAIKKGVSKAFKKLDYKVSIWAKTGNQNTSQCSIGNSKYVLKYYQEIGVSNPKHGERFKKFCSAPIV